MKIASVKVNGQKLTKTKMLSLNLAIALVIFLGNYADCAERVTTKSLKDVLEFVKKQKSKSSADSILVVYDFDNTLMAMNMDLGSDQWYQWQSAALKDADSKQAMVKTKAQLFALQYKLYALVDMHAVEKETPEVVKEIQAMNIKSIVLTSRGSVLRGDVEIELDRAGISFKNSAIGPVGGYPSTFIPQGFENAREVSYQNGIVMGSGQNKGVVLKAILAKVESKFKTIVFVDDTLSNIENVEKEFDADKEEALTTFFYTHEEDRVKKFEKDKSEVWREWKKLKPLLDYFEARNINSSKD